NSRWREWKIFTEDDLSRMQEVELISEMSISILEQKINGRLTSSKIEEYYKKYDQKYPERLGVERRIRYTMEFISKYFPGNRKNFIFYKKTLFFTFFFACYDKIYGFKSSIVNVRVIHKPETAFIESIK